MSGTTADTNRSRISNGGEEDRHDIHDLPQKAERVNSTCRIFTCRIFT